MLCKNSSAQVRVTAANKLRKIDIHITLKVVNGIHSKSTVVIGEDVRKKVNLCCQFNGISIVFPQCDKDAFFLLSYILFPEAILFKSINNIPSQMRSYYLFYLNFKYIYTPEKNKMI